MRLNYPFGGVRLLDEQFHLHDVLLGISQDQFLKILLLLPIPGVRDLDASSRLAPTVTNVECVLAPPVGQDRVDQFADVGVALLQRPHGLVLARSPNLLDNFAK